MAYRNHFVCDTFDRRHLGNSQDTIQTMLSQLGLETIEQLIGQTIPASIRATHDLALPKSLTEFEYLNLIRTKAEQNQVFRSYIGMGYYGTIMPAVIRRNVFENPGWYTQYTPYQAEIAQGRLEALLNFQTMVSDLTGLPIANASLLDEATAAAEAMNMFFGQKNKRKVTAPKFFVDQAVFPQTLSVLHTRAEPLGIEIVVGDFRTAKLDERYFGVLVQYPNAEGSIEDYRDFVVQAHQCSAYVTVAADLLSLTLLTPPAEWGADAVVGTTQRFGVPMGFGGPHAAYFATQEAYKRDIPGRIIGVSVDRHGKPALRMALQTREQHIRRDKATSNICTAQALLAVIAGMYAVYHGAEGLKGIASSIHNRTVSLAQGLNALGYELKHQQFFDTVVVDGVDASRVKALAEAKQINFYYPSAHSVQISLDETVAVEDVADILAIFKALGTHHAQTQTFDWSALVVRNSVFMQQAVFNAYRTETELMRYLKSLENKDLSLVHSMIALGSCTMKLNAAVELEPLSWPQFANIHPFAPSCQTKGYQSMIQELEQYLAVITGFDATSLQPNSGAQGEFAGLLVIKAYHQARGDYHRNVILIPSSAHGTNPASAAMIGAKIVVVNCDSYGNIDKEDLFAKAQLHAENLSGLMITYPSTHGVYEHHIKEIIDAVHQHGGQVYMDGANMNAQVALTSPGIIGADVCHLNLHKTFAIPHGGGGPGMGPICVKKHLAPFLPSNPIVKTGGDKAISAVSAAPWGSASILLISYAYIRLLGAEGLKQATQQAILNANYIKSRLESRYDVLYVGKEFGRVAHELIVDFRGFKKSCGIEVEDVAKRLVDYGFHAPTMSFPVADTIMIEPTESESKAELDRFCDALLAIRDEIDAIEKGAIALLDSPLKNAPHTVAEVTADEWKHRYTRQVAAYPLAYVAEHKFWPSVARIDNAHGDRNLICTCPSIEDYR